MSLSIESSSSTAINTGKLIPPSALEKHPATSVENAAGENGTLEPQGTFSYRVTISEEALRKAGLLKDKSGSSNTADPTVEKTKDQLESMKRRDQEVRTHEQAHIAAGGSLVRGGASFGYVSGPDGRLYAVSGEVSIDSSPVNGDPQATIRKMQQVVKAALAPAQPSGPDRAAAAAAISEQVEAQGELAKKQAEAVPAGSGKPAPAKAVNAEPHEQSTHGLAGRAESGKFSMAAAKQFASINLRA